MPRFEEGVDYVIRTDGWPPFWRQSGSQKLIEAGLWSGELRDEEPDVESVVERFRTTPPTTRTPAAAFTSTRITNMDTNTIAAAERARIKTILDSPEAKGREASARHLALETPMGAEEACGLLRTMSATPSRSSSATQGSAGVTLDPRQIIAKRQADVAAARNSAGNRR